jgi:hypothetical protein
MLVRLKQIRQILSFVYLSLLAITGCMLQTRDPHRKQVDQKQQPRSNSSVASVISTFEFNIPQLRAGFLAGSCMINMFARTIHNTVGTRIKHLVTNSTIKVVKIRLPIAGPVLNNEEIQICLR